MESKIAERELKARLTLFALLPFIAITFMLVACAVINHYFPSPIQIETNDK